MARLKIVLGLITNDNDYQREQATQAGLAAQRLGLDLQVVYANGDAVVQSQQLLDAIQAAPGQRPNGIIFDPVSETGLPHVARAAVSAGIGWAVIDLKPTYFNELRVSASAPIFGIGTDQVEVGRIQGRQLMKLLPRGGNVLVIEGPSQNITARERTQGLQQATKTSTFNLRYLKGKWSEESGYQAMKGYLALSTARPGDTHCIAAHTDVMAMGARHALEEVSAGPDRQRWLSVPFLGCDGLPGTGQAWVAKKKLMATVVIPPNASLALEIMADALNTGKLPPEYSTTTPRAFPELSLLQSAG